MKSHHDFVPMCHDFYLKVADLSLSEFGDAESIAQHI